jgi:regulation of enolase protein 1 (concanavalin A-like superfamily)
MLHKTRLRARLAIHATLALTVVCTTSAQFVGDLSNRSPSTAPATQPTKADGWGEWVDPGGDATLRRVSDARVTLEVPAGTYDLWPEGKKVNAPRLMQPVAGDFTIQVKAIGSVLPDKGTETPGRDIAFRAASLVIWQDENNFVRFDRAAMLKKGTPFSMTYYHINQAGKRTTHLNKAVRHDVDVWLRLQRKGDTIIAGFSEDGTKWTDYPPQTAKLADKLHAGVAVLNASNAPAIATFEALELRSAE